VDNLSASSSVFLYSASARAISMRMRMSSGMFERSCSLLSGKLMDGGGVAGRLGGGGGACAAADIAASNTQAIGRINVFAILTLGAFGYLGYLNFYHSRKANFKSDVINRREPIANAGAKSTVVWPMITPSIGPEP
jgi:hypothetical protein